MKALAALDARPHDKAGGLRLDVDVDVDVVASVSRHARQARVEPVERPQ
jgi:hypothetical protein